MKKVCTLFLRQRLKKQLFKMISFSTLPLIQKLNFSSEKHCLKSRNIWNNVHAKIILLRINYLFVNVLFRYQNHERQNAWKIFSFRWYDCVNVKLSINSNTKIESFQHIITKKNKNSCIKIWKLSLIIIKKKWWAFEWNKKNVFEFTKIHKFHD